MKPYLAAALVLACATTPTPTPPAETENPGIEFLAVILAEDGWAVDYTYSAFGTFLTLFGEGMGGNPPGVDFYYLPPPPLVVGVDGVLTWPFETGCCPAHPETVGEAFAGRANLADVDSLCLDWALAQPELRRDPSAAEGCPGQEKLEELHRQETSPLSLLQVEDPPGALLKSTPVEEDMTLERAESGWGGRDYRQAKRSKALLDEKANESEGE